MNPGLVVKLRPSGPWRIGPDSGARNRVDAIYHSDSLYSAVTAAMVRLGWLEEWLDATARNGSSAVSFSSCFPYMDEIGFVVPPRTIWPPVSPSAKAARVRWKSARFVPLTVVESILAGRRLDENQWSIDGPSGCLVPADRPGPFRTAVRWSAAVDRLTGSSDRHSTACLEFRPGSGLWTVVSFQDEAAAEGWSARVKAAFRLLADTGFGGERSRGWGRSEAPEFLDGTLPDLILPPPAAAPAAPPAPPAAVAPPPEATPIPLPAPPPSEVLEASVEAASPVLPLVAEAEAEPEVPTTAPQPEGAAEPVEAAPTTAAVEPQPEAAPAPPESAGGEPASINEIEAPSPATAEAAPTAELAPPAAEAVEVQPEPAAALPEPAADEPAHVAEIEAPSAAPTETVPTAELAAPAAEAVEPQPEPAAVEPTPVNEIETPSAETVAVTEVPAEAAGSAAIEPVATAEVAEAQPEAAVPPVEPAAVEPVTGAEAEPSAAEVPAVAEIPAAPASPAAPTHPHWLLSVFTPAATDTVDWRRGNYTVLARGGRVDSPAGSGELKKQIQMVAEGSVVYAETAPRGSAADVAPDGFAHPVFRAGFALAIPLPEVS